MDKNQEEEREMAIEMMKMYILGYEQQIISANSLKQYLELCVDKLLNAY